VRKKKDQKKEWRDPKKKRYGWGQEVQESSWNNRATSGSIETPQERIRGKKKAFA